MHVLTSTCPEYSDVKDVWHRSLLHMCSTYLYILTATGLETEHRCKRDRSLVHLYSAHLHILTYAGSSNTNKQRTGNRSVGRVLDLWLKGWSQQCWENFLFQDHLSVLTLVLVSVPMTCFGICSNDLVSVPMTLVWVSVPTLCYCSSIQKIPVILPKV